MNSFLNLVKSIQCFVQSFGFSYSFSWKTDKLSLADIRLSKWLVFRDGQEYNVKPFCFLSFTTSGFIITGIS